MMMRRRAVVLGAIVLFSAVALTGCVGRIGANDYLNSLRRDHVLDPKAEALCLKWEGTPKVRPLVAANSTLKFVRTLESRLEMQRSGDQILLGVRQGYAAICLYKTTDFGKPVEVWGYTIESGDNGYIDPE